MKSSASQGADWVKGNTVTTSSLVMIGNFDGVHRGHQAVFDLAVANATQQNLVPLVLTFSPHPALVLGRTPPPILTTLPRKIQLIERIDPSIRVVVATFDRAFSEQTPEQFAQQVLREQLHARAVVVGDNFRFGHRRAGDFALLGQLGAALGFEVRSHSLVGDAVGAWSSTRIRQAIASGQLDMATTMLGRPHAISGIVVRGDQRGRTIGFPTCNLSQVEETTPPLGVYATLVDRIEEGTDSQRGVALARGVANIGLRPTIKDEGRLTIEVHLLDHEEDLYDARLRVHLIAYLRPEQKFGGLTELKDQIARDVTQAKTLLAPLQVDPRARAAWR